MFEPNLYTHEESSGVWGLHRFKSDGAVYLCKRYVSGDWFIVRPPVAAETKYFETHGKQITTTKRN